MLHAPDFLGYDGAVAMARDHRGDRGARAADQEGRQRADRGSSAAARCTRSTCASAASTGRPTKRELRALLEPLKRRARTRSRPSRWTATLDFPDLETDYELVALSEPDDYPIERGRLRLERRARHRAAGVRGALRGGAGARTRTRCTRGSRERGSYLVGPLARYALSSDRLSPLAREAAAEAGLGAVVPQPVPEHRGAQRGDPLRVRRGDADHRGLRGARPAGGGRRRPGRARATAGPRRPRGMLWHRYTLDERGHDPGREDRAAHLAEPARRSRRTCARSWRATSICATRRCSCAASRRSATTTPASPAPPTS